MGTGAISTVKGFRVVPGGHRCHLNSEGIQSGSWWAQVPSAAEEHPKIAFRPLQMVMVAAVIIRR